MIFVAPLWAIVVLALYVGIIYALVGASEEFVDE